MTGIIIWLAIYMGVLIWSAIQPYDYLIWFLEVLPAVVVLIILGVTRRRFPLTSLLYWLILGHAVILMIGGHYTYARVPLFEWLQPLFGWERNNYDKLGHFAQGFVPAIAAREILIRFNVIEGRAWLAGIVVAICLAISAFYELIEWWVALASDEAAAGFLGSQGYVWDTQSDMGWALVGAILALLLLSRRHDRQLERLPAH